MDNLYSIIYRLSYQKPVLVRSVSIEALRDFVVDMLVLRRVPCQSIDNLRTCLLFNIYKLFTKMASRGSLSSIFIVGSELRRLD